jgi:hypothetical protein
MGERRSTSSNAMLDPRRLVALVLGVGLAGCTLITDSFLTNEFSGDPFPIEVETQSGAIVVGLREAGAADRIAVVDLLSPFTLTDPGPEIRPSVSSVDLTLLGKTGGGAAIDLAAVVPRAQFRDKQVIALHPCPDRTFEGELNLECAVGTPAAPRVFQSIIGADALAGDAVRLRLGDNRMFILADVGGSDRGRSQACDAVFNSPYRGGGTLVIAGTEVPFGNRRITLQACLGPDRDLGRPPDSPEPATPAPDPRQRGASALLVMSTSIGISILGEAAYERYRLAVAADPLVSAPALEDLPTGSAYLPSGLVAGRLATINRLTLVSNSSSNPLSPCRQIYAHQFFFPGDCDDRPDLECPCKSGDVFCAVPAMLALDPPTGLAVLVVADTDPTLQALRTELRPDQPEVDGVLGTDALRTAEIDVDYPHDRLVARCAAGGCIARPQFAENTDAERTQLRRCVPARPAGP